jgi:hypothetical protein
MVKTWKSEGKRPAAEKGPNGSLVSGDPSPSLARKDHTDFGGYRD